MNTRDIIRQASTDDLEEMDGGASLALALGISGSTTIAELRSLIRAEEERRDELDATR